MNILYVFLGGGAGAVCRWAIGVLLQNNPDIPVHTLLVNLLGCLLIGVASAFLLQHNSRVNLILTVGFLGGFTTFSSFGIELFNLANAGQWKNFAWYFILSNVGGLIAVILGNRMTSSLMNT